MVILKIWLGALAALVVFLCLQALLQDRAEYLERTPVAHRA